jgi:hypothetical protein
MMRSGLLAGVAFLLALQRVGGGKWARNNGIVGDVPGPSVRGACVCAIIGAFLACLHASVFCRDVLILQARTRSRRAMARCGSMMIVSAAPAVKGPHRSRGLRAAICRGGKWCSSSTVPSMTCTACAAAACGIPRRMSP